MRAMSVEVLPGEEGLDLTNLPRSCIAKLDLLSCDERMEGVYYTQDGQVCLIRDEEAEAPSSDTLQEELMVQSA